MDSIFEKYILIPSILSYVTTSPLFDNKTHNRQPHLGQAHSLFQTHSNIVPHDHDPSLHTYIAYAKASLGFEIEDAGDDDSLGRVLELEYPCVYKNLNHLL